MGIGPYELADVKITQIPNVPFSPERREQIIKENDPNENLVPQKPSFVGNGEKLGDNNTEIISVNLSAELDPSITRTRIQIVLPNGSRKVITTSARSKVSDLYATIKRE